MIGGSFDPVRGKFFRQELGIVPAHTIDDAALPTVGIDEVDDSCRLFLFIQSSPDGERQVGTVEGRNEDFRITQVQLVDDIGTGYFIGCRCQCHDRYLWKMFFQDGQLGIFRTEIMSPMRDTVSFIDGYQGDIHTGKQPMQFAYQSFGRDVKQLYFSLDAELFDLVAFFFRHHAVERGCRNTVGYQSAYLVFHQGDQWGDDNCCSGQVNSRKLIANRFSSTGRHQHQRILFPQNALYDLRLQRAERSIPKKLL